MVNAAETDSELIGNPFDRRVSEDCKTERKLVSCEPVWVASKLELVPDGWLDEVSGSAVRLFDIGSPVWLAVIREEIDELVCLP